MRKLRIKGWDEGGHKKKGKSTNEDEGDKRWDEEGDNEIVLPNAKGQKMIRGPMTCKRCGGKGHRQASSKCPLNGTVKEG
jgi:RecJ-like exonuclease